MSTKTARTLSIRLDQTDTQHLADFEDRTGVDGVTLGRNALRACLAYFQAGGTITFPLVLNPAHSGTDPIPAYLREPESAEATVTAPSAAAAPGVIGFSGLTWLQP
jgi:hypothetical protein